jgi:hypothetical protein
VRAAQPPISCGSIQRLNQRDIKRHQVLPRGPFFDSAAPSSPKPSSRRPCRRSSSDGRRSRDWRGIFQHTRCAPGS